MIIVNYEFMSTKPDLQKIPEVPIQTEKINILRGWRKSKVC